MNFILILLLVVSSGVNAENAEEKLVWPPPPDKPKIEWVKSINKIEDIRGERSFFGKLIDAILGREERQIIKPFGSFAKGDVLYLTDTGARAVFILDLKKRKVEVIDEVGDYKFSSPIDVVVDNRGNIYVSDSVLGAVFVFNSKGKYKGKIGSKILQRPTGLAIDNKLNRLYVTDTLAGKIYIFDLNGKLIKRFGKIGQRDGEFNKPTYLTLDKKGYLYVVDTMNARIQIFDKEGNFISKFGKRGTVIGTFANPRGIAVDSDGNIYVTDTLLSAIQIFDRKGQLLLVIGYYGTKKGEFAFPEDISISDKNYIFVSDSYNMRVQILRYLKGGK
ncbi:6-bladed beta-propeller [Persephonella sp.]